MPLSSASLKSYDRLISWSRKGILGLIGCFFVALMSWPSLTRVSQEAAKFVNLTSQAMIENHMENPHFSSLSEKGAPYEVWAEKGKNMTSEVINLVHPQGKFHDLKGQEITLEAKEGHYTKNKNILVLTENVRVKDSLGYHLSTKKATVDMKKKEILGDYPVEGEGPAGSLKGERFQIKNNGESLLLEGKSRLVIRSSKQSVRIK